MPDAVPFYQNCNKFTCPTEFYCEYFTAANIFLSVGAMKITSSNTLHAKTGPANIIKNPMFLPLSLATNTLSYFESGIFF